MRTAQAKNHLLAAIAPALLILVATIQHFAVFRYQLAPQRGGGFGMFSAIDSSRNRYLKAFLIADQQTYALKLPDAFYNQALLSEALPTGAQLTQFANRIARQSWFAATDPGLQNFLWAYPTASPPDQNPLKPTKVRLEFWQTDMDHQGHLSLKLSKSHEVDAR